MLTVISRFGNIGRFWVFAFSKFFILSLFLIRKREIFNKT